MSLMVHLWQSTVCVGIAALLALALRQASARTRHAIWLLASVKFFVPLSLFVVAGRHIGLLTWPLAIPEGSIAIRWLDRSLSLWNLDAVTGSNGPGLPFGMDRHGLLALALVWASGVAVLAAWRWKQWQGLSRLARAATETDCGREAEILQRVTRSSRRPQRIELRQCQSSAEPGVLGIFRPTLLWPAGLTARLSDAELEAILTHEACHVDRRDNVSALIHMVVETVFWFHPLVWWLGARLVNERERACDEEVLHMGADKHSYAEGILKVCSFCLRAPQAFVAGVGGSSLTPRIERILRRPTAGPLTISARLLLAGVLIITAGGPFVSGVLGAKRADGGTALSNSPLAADQDKPTVYRKGDGIKMPKLVTEVKPEYTPEAMQARIQGGLLLTAVVLESGVVGDVEIVESLDKVYGLDDQAIKAVRQWHFEPGTKDGTPVAVRIEVEITFTLK
jgi:bla regulator protein blaR1